MAAVAASPNLLPRNIQVVTFNCGRSGKEKCEQKYAIDNNFEIIETYDDGDCFYDTILKFLQEIKHPLLQSVKFRQNIPDKKNVLKLLGKDHYFHKIYSNIKGIENKDNALEQKALQIALRSTLIQLCIAKYEEDNDKVDKMRNKIVNNMTRKITKQYNNEKKNKKTLNRNINTKVEEKLGELHNMKTRGATLEGLTRLLHSGEYAGNSGDIPPQVAHIVFGINIINHSFHYNSKNKTATIMIIPTIFNDNPATPTINIFHTGAHYRLLHPIAKLPRRNISRSRSKSRSKSRSRSRSRSINKTANKLNKLNVKGISEQYTVEKLKGILLRLGVGDEKIKRTKLKLALITLYKRFRALMEKLSLGTLTPAEEIELQQMM